MAASPQRVRESMRVERTRDDAGWKTSVDVVAYDNGMVSVNGIPINNIKRDRNPEAHGWLGAAEVAVLTVGEFRRRVEREQAHA